MSCDPEGSSSGGATPQRFTLTPNGDGTTFTLAIREGVKTIAMGEFAAVASAGKGIALNTKLVGKLGANPKQAVTKIVLPSTLSSIGDYAFSNHQKVKGKFMIPKRVRTIGKESFLNLGNPPLVPAASPPLAITFEEPSQLVAIGERAFRFARASVLKLPESLETIGNAAFMNLEGFTTNSFTIPGNVKRIGNLAFVDLVVSRSTIFTGTLTIASPHLTRTPADTTQPMDGNLGNSLFIVVPGGGSSSFTTIKLHKTVYDSYTKADLNQIFGTGSTYQDLGGANHAIK